MQTEPELTLSTPEFLGQAEDGMTLYAATDARSGRFVAAREIGSLDGDLVVVLGWASKLGRN